MIRTIWRVGTSAMFQNKILVGPNEARSIFRLSSERIRSHWTRSTQLVQSGAVIQRTGVLCCGRRNTYHFHFILAIHCSNVERLAEGSAKHRQRVERRAGQPNQTHVHCHPSEIDFDATLT